MAIKLIKLQRNGELDATVELTAPDEPTKTKGSYKLTRNLPGREGLPITATLSRQAHYDSKLAQALAEGFTPDETVG
jgi:hypothetical protein